jgi:hypothetical protein
MARAPHPLTRARKRQTSVQYDEQRPVLQLPLESPSWREPASEPERSDRSEDRDRGIAVVDFYI